MNTATSPQPQNELNERIQHHLQQIEHIIDHLLTEISLGNLTPAECLVYATRLLPPYARMLALQHTVQLTEHTATEEELFQTQLRQLMLKSVQCGPLANEDQTKA